MTFLLVVRGSYPRPDVGHEFLVVILTVMESAVCLLKEYARFPVATGTLRVRDG